MDSNSSSSKTRLTHLDGLRALAALFVVFHHAWAQVWPVFLAGGESKWPHGLDLTATGFLYYGHFAVGVFIVLSGFCLMLPHVQHISISVDSTCEFFGKRLRRIIPTYYAALFFCLILIHFFIGHKTGTHWDNSLPVTLHGFVYHMLLLQDVYKNHEIDYPMWSIAVEWHIYLLFPIILLLWQHIGAWITTGFTALVVYILHLDLQNTPYTDVTPQYLLLFVFGMLAASITFSSNEKWIAVRQRVPWISLSCLAAGSLVITCSLLGFSKSAAIQDWLDLLIGFSTMTLLVGTSLSPASRLHQCLSWKPLVWIGGFSYSLYLIHAPLLQIIYQYFILPHKATLGERNMFLLLADVGIPIIVGVSYLFFYAFERPLLTSPKVKIDTISQNAQERKIVPQTR